MANLASTGVVTNANYTGNGNNGKKHSFKEVTVTLSSMGTTTNTIPAAAFGMSKIAGSSPWTLSDNSIVVVANPNVLGTLLLLKAAATNAPADYTGAFTATIWGTAL